MGKTNLGHDPRFWPISTSHPARPTQLPFFFYISWVACAWGPLVGLTPGMPGLASVSPPCEAYMAGPSSSSDFFFPNPKRWDPSTPGQPAISLVRARPLWFAGGTRSVRNLQQQRGPRSPMAG